MQHKVSPKPRLMLCLISAIAMLLGSLPGVTGGQAPAASGASVALHAAPKHGIAVNGKGATGLATYIVRLKDAPLASYRGGLSGLSATNPHAIGANKLNVRSAASVAYRGYLARQRAQISQSIVQTLGHPVQTIYEYDVTLNGMAVRLTAAEAARVAALPGVVSVRPDAWRQPTTTVSPAFIGATGIWNGTATGGLPGTKGQGIIVGVIDTGIWPEHPSFADDHTYPAPPAGWGGTCAAPADATAPYTCTNKLIGVQFFLSGYIASNNGTYDGLFRSGRDDEGHGTHTASTAAGNEGVDVTLFGVPRGKASGIAPRAYVAAYKVLGPQGGVTSDLVAGIDKAVADGVDVINYSIGSTSPTDPWIDGDALAFLAARDAGVFVAVSAGNSGPNPDTIGSPANAPWVTTVAASTSNRQYTSVITLTGSISPTIHVYGDTVTAGVTDFRLRDTQGISDTKQDASGLCLNPYAPGTFQAHDVALCQRGVNGRLEKGDNVKAGGAGGLILFNPVLQDLDTDNFSIPGVHVQNDTGATIKNYIHYNPVITVTFSAGTETFAPNPGLGVLADEMAAFSSRGPNGDGGPTVDIVKPDVTAPGVQIMAGASPNHYGPGAQGQLFQSIQGTSMSSPHVAGAAALLKALHPTWTPAEIQSALMSTAKTTGVVKEDGSTAADPFDRGGGRIDLTVAARAGLVLNETTTNYENADPFLNGDPKTLNEASLGDSACVVTCSWTRRLKSTASAPVTWTVSSTVPTSMTLTATPSSFTLNPGATRVLTFTANTGTLPIGEWAFGQVNFTPNTTTTVEAHFPIAIQPTRSNLPGTLDVNALRNTGTYTVTDLKAIAITSLTSHVYGLTEAQLTYRSLRQDSDNSDPFDNLTDGVFYITKTVSLNTKRLVAEITASKAPDLDLYVGKDNGDGVPQEGEIVCTSAGGSADEYCNINDPTPGVYWILIESFAGSGSQPDALTLATAVVPSTSSNNLTVSGPSSVPGGTPFNLRLTWNTARMAPGSRWYGAFDLGTSAASAGNLGLVDVNLVGPRGIYLPVLKKN
jgi:subtilisin family serine protease